jgi:hypothetical protein
MATMVKRVIAALLERGFLRQLWQGRSEQEGDRKAASARGRCMKPPVKPFPADPGKGSRLIGRAGDGKVQ